VADGVASRRCHQVTTAYSRFFRCSDHKSLTRRVVNGILQPADVDVDEKDDAEDALEFVLRDRADE